MHNNIKEEKTTKTCENPHLLASSYYTIVEQISNNWQDFPILWLGGTLFLSIYAKRNNRIFGKRFHFVRGSNWWKHAKELHIYIIFIFPNFHKLCLLPTWILKNKQIIWPQSVDPKKVLWYIYPIHVVKFGKVKKCNLNW
jgi:hypothetical protein